MYDLNVLESQIHATAAAAVRAIQDGEPERFCELTTQHAAMLELYAHVGRGGLVN
jgi:hypothetical protein